MRATGVAKCLVEGAGADPRWRETNPAIQVIVDDFSEMEQS